jgi:hypothetical protein
VAADGDLTTSLNSGPEPHERGRDDQVTTPRGKRKATYEDAVRIFSRTRGKPMSQKDFNKLNRLLDSLSPEEIQTWKESQVVMSFDVLERTLDVGLPGQQCRVAQGIYDRYYGIGAVRIEQPVDVQGAKRVLGRLRRRMGIGRRSRREKPKKA